MAKYKDADAFLTKMSEVIIEAEKTGIYDDCDRGYLGGLLMAKTEFERFPAADVVERPKEAGYFLEMLDCKRLDEEQGHILADQILCNLLEELGYHKLVNAFKNLGKWYS